METEAFQTLLKFFKALANDSRLKIIGLLAGRDYTVRELAELLNLKEPTVSEHLNALKELDLVRVRAQGNRRIYSFNSKALHGMNRDIFSREQFASLVQTEDEDERKVFQSFFEGDRLKALPASRKKSLVILNWFAKMFEAGVRYTEREVNEIILRHYEDYATVRRELVDWDFMQREKGIYWLIPEAERPTEANRKVLID